MRNKNDLCLSFTLVFFTFIIIHSIFHHHQATADSSLTQNKRETLEIIIGDGTSPPTFSPEPDCPPPVLPPEPECPPPSSPPPPPPPPPSLPVTSPKPPSPHHGPPSNPSPNPFLLAALNAIQEFKKLITSDPQGITKTWRGNNICKDKSKYKGFICATFPNEKQVKVVGIKFNGYNFKGKHLELTELTKGLKDLVFIHVNSNNFTGTIPSAITKFPRLYELDLSNNKYTGSFPETVLGATKVNILDLRYNQFASPLPRRVFTLDLIVLFLNNNNFHGDIPDNLGDTRALYLTLANNQLTGPIPKSIGQTSNTLLEVLFLGNQLSGCLPYEIGLLKKATVFDASYNMLTGPIPHSFACLAKMQLLNFAHNKLFGPVPEQLCKLANLNKLTLNNNYFTEVGPECRKLIRNNMLDVSMNCILGLDNQRNAADCKYFFSEKRYCPNDRSYSYVPCKIDYSASKPGVAMAPSPTYAALINNP